MKIVHIYIIQNVKKNGGIVKQDLTNYANIVSLKH